MTKLNERNYAHEMVANVAREMAQEVFEVWARNNVWYAENKDHRSEIVGYIAETLRPAARNTLATMLGRDDVPESQKAQIYEAIQLDKLLPDQHGEFHVAPPTMLN